MSKKDEILQAAIECFTLYGYEKASMSDIGKRVGLNKASLYYHYRDKLALFDAVIQTKRLAHRNILRDRLNHEEIGIPQIVVFLCTEIDFVEQLGINFLGAASSNRKGKDDTTPVFNTLIEEDIRLLQSMIQASQAKGRFQNSDPHNLAHLILQTTRGLLMAVSPLDMPLSERSAGFEKARQDIHNILPLLLKGAGA